MYHYIIMAEESDGKRDSIKREIAKGQGQPGEIAPPVHEKEKQAIQEYTSEEKPASAKTKIEYTKVIAKEENYKTPEQLSDEDYKVAPTSADEERVKA
jgi:hypothetical protein